MDFILVRSLKGAGTGAVSSLARALRRPGKFLVDCYDMTGLRRDGVTALQVADVGHPNFCHSVPVGSVGFVAGFNQIFRNSLIQRFSSFVNFHPSILPCYRGAIPSYWVIKNGEPITGVTAHAIVERIDAGEILYQELVEVNPGISEVDLDNKIARVGAYYLAECLRRLKEGRPFRRRPVMNPYRHEVDYVSSVRI